MVVTAVTVTVVMVTVLTVVMVEKEVFSLCTTNLALLASAVC